MLLIPVNDLTPAQQQQQYENLMHGTGTSLPAAAPPFYNKGYGAGTTDYTTRTFGQQPAQHSLGVGGLPQPPAQGFLNWQPGQHGYGN